MLVVVAAQCDPSIAADAVHCHNTEGVLVAPAAPHCRESVILVLGDVR